MSDPAVTDKYVVLVNGFRGMEAGETIVTDPTQEWIIAALQNEDIRVANPDE